MSRPGCCPYSGKCMLKTAEATNHLALWLGRTGAPRRDCSRWVSPARPPHPACGSHRTGRSTCLARWLAGCCRLGCPRGRDVAAAVAVAGDRHGGRAGEPDPVDCERPGAGDAEAPPEFWHPDAGASLFVLMPQPAHDPAPRVGVDLAEDGLGHSVPEVVRPPGQCPVDALDERLRAL